MVPSRDGGVESVVTSVSACWGDPLPLFGDAFADSDDERFEPLESGLSELLAEIIGTNSISEKANLLFGVLYQRGLKWTNLMGSNDFALKSSVPVVRSLRQ